jgi:hypothetical protein
MGHAWHLETTSVPEAERGLFSLGQRRRSAAGACCVGFQFLSRAPTRKCAREQTDPDLNEAIDAAIPHVHHVHCRVGFEQGPQVSDPFAPEWKQVPFFAS